MGLFLLSLVREVEKLVSRRAHNSQVTGSSPVLATMFSIFHVYRLIASMGLITQIGNVCPSFWTLETKQDNYTQEA